MTRPVEPAPSSIELAVVRHADVLANLPAKNKYQDVIPSLIPRWFFTAPPHLRAALRASMQKGHDTQQYVSRVLAQIKPMEEFAEPLLTAALVAHGWWEAAPRTYGLKEVHLLSNVLVFIANQHLEMVDNLIHLLLPDAWIPQSLEIDLVSSITQLSLLQAAMLNFEAQQSAAGGFAAGSAIFETRGRQNVVKPELTAGKFAQICRDLNLGAQYQWHLDRVFSPIENEWPADDPRSKATEIKVAFSSNLRHDFESALHIAYMKSEINAFNYSLIVNMILALPSNTAPPGNLHSTFEILDFEISGVMVIWPERKPPEQKQSCVVYLAQSPFKSFYEFESFDAFKIGLRQWLKSPQFSAYFVQRVPVRHRAEFIRRTDIRHATWDSLLLLRPPIIHEPALLSLSRHKPQTGDPFEVAWQLQLDQIKDDARMLMVPTEDEDTRSRLARQAMFLNLGLSMMGMALGFVPVVGEILLATSVLQMGEEVYEGLRAWQHGDRVAALEHLFDVTENIVLAAGTAATVKLLRPVPAVDSLIPVRRVTGHKRLWRPDISGYELKGISLSGLEHDERGVYEVRGRSVILLEGKVYEVKVEPQSGLFHMKHPKDATAYSPRLFYNGSGVWVHDLENPVAWPRSQLLHRLGVEAQGLSDQALEQCLTLTNTSEAVLRKMYAENLKIPPLLLDSLRRVRLNERIDGFIRRMKQGLSGDPGQAEIELQLLTRLPGWPADKVLRVVDSEKATIKEYATDLDLSNPRVQIAQSQIKNGELLKVTLECLSEYEIDQLLGERVPWIYQQVEMLAKTLGERAEQEKQDLFARLFNASEQVVPETNVFRQHFLSLPAGVIEELVAHMTPVQQLEMGTNGRLPLPVLEEARCYVQALRVNRTIDAIYHPAMGGADSQNVALHLLPRLPGWPGNLRLVLRDGTTGEVLTMVGNRSAAYTREIIRTGDAYEYHGRSRGDVQRSKQLLDTVLLTLNGPERTALGLGTTRPQQDLRIKVGDLAARERHLVARVLGMHRIKPWFKSPLRLADGRVGYPLGGRTGRIAPESNHQLKDLVLDLYPAMNDVQAGQFLYRLKLSQSVLTRTLVNLKAELDTLRLDLQNWEASAVWSEMRGGGRLFVTGETKRAISQTLIRAWRRQTPSLQIDGQLGYELDLNGWPVDRLPELSADFSHITSLNLVNSSNGKFPVAFLSKFPKLQVMTLKNCQLRELPAAIAGMPELVHLNLRANRIELNDESVAILSGLRKLKSLNLVGNRLNRRLSVRNMPALEHLSLRYTGITEWPEGIEAVAGLLALDMRDNGIQVIPQEILTAERISLNRVTALHDNPLNYDSLRRLEIYNREYGVNLGIDNLREHISSREGILNWALIPSHSQRAMWSSLERQEGSADFFRVIEDLQSSSQFLHQHGSLAQRVWSLTQAMHDHTELRQRVFEIASNPRTCSDGIAMIFADMELHQLVFMAHGEANTAGSLLKLAHGLFRIELLNRHVVNVVERRVAAIRGQQVEHVQRLQQLVDEVGVDLPTRPLAEMGAVEQQGIAYRLGTPESLELAELISPAGVQRQLALLDPLQVQMFYHVKLAEELQLPARPKSMRFARIAEVTVQDLETAREYVLGEDKAGAFSTFVTQRDFWQEFVFNKYPEEFVTADSAQDERMSILFAARESMPSHDYVVQSNALGRWREQSREALIEMLTQREIAENPQAPLPGHQG